MAYLEARIIHVDPERLACDAISIDGKSFVENIMYSNTGVKKSGHIHNPEIGDVIVVDVQGDGSAEMVRYYPGFRRDLKAGTSHAHAKLGYGESKESLPGDQMWASPDGAFINLLRGGMASIGASPMSQTIYCAIEGLVRTLAQNYEFISSGARVYTVNDNGNIITRLCFNSKDRAFVHSAHNNQDLESESFEYQIDFAEHGMIVFIGELNPDTLKRKDNFVMSIRRNGEASVSIGGKVFMKAIPSGAIEFSMLTENFDRPYQKTIALTSNGKVLVEELIDGDYVRKVTGNVYEEVDGMNSQKSKSHTVLASVFDVNASINRKVSGMNVDEINAAPNTDVYGR